MLSSSSITLKNKTVGPQRSARKRNTDIIDETTRPIEIKKYYADLERKEKEKTRRLKLAR